jgi:hypothetical protein
LKQVDIGGAYAYTDIRRVDFGKKVLFSLLNNPSNGSDVIVKTSLINSTLSVFDISGKKISEQLISNNNCNIKVSKLPSGTYLAVVNKNGKIEAIEKFVITR